MGLLSRVKQLKKAYELTRVGIAGLPQFPSTSIHSLQRWHRRSEIVYACIRKICEAAIDPEPIVERQNAQGLWQPVLGHPLRRLLLKPNPEMDYAQFMQHWLASEQIAGVFYAEIVRSRAGLPVQLWPLDPSKVFAVPSESGQKSRISHYEFRDAGLTVRLETTDLLVSRLVNTANPYVGLSPLSVALGSVEADAQQTDFIRAFYENSGVPSGIIKIKGVLPKGDAGKTRVREIIANWIARYGWGGEHQGAPAVFDDNADYQKVGSGIAEIDNATTRYVAEAKICQVFGVPPLLVGALVGLVYVNQRGPAKQAQREFWDNTMSPMLKRLRTFLTWNLLPEFEDPQQIERERVRCGWDMREVGALQEDISARSMRAREDFRVGGLTLNEFRTILGMPPLPEGNYYLRPLNRLPVTADVLQQQLQTVAGALAETLALQLTGNRDVGTAVEDVLDQAGQGAKARRLLGKADDDETQTYTLWTYNASGSTRGCSFCESLDGKQVITFDGVAPVSYHIPNPLCDWPKHCACWWDKQEGLSGAEILGFPDAVRDYLGGQG